MKLTGDDIVIRLGQGGAQVVIDNVRIVPKIDQRSRTFQIYARADNPQGRLASGFSVIGYIPTGARKEHLLVPIDALLRNELGAYVYVATQMEQAASLHANDRVITEGNQRLYPTAPITISSDGDKSEGAEPESAQHTKPMAMPGGEG